MCIIFMYMYMYCMLHVQVKRASLVDSRTAVNDVKFAPRHLGLQLVSDPIHIRIRPSSHRRSTVYLGTVFPGIHGYLGYNQFVG